MDQLNLAPDQGIDMIDSFNIDTIIMNSDGIIIKATDIPAKQYGVEAVDLIGNSEYDLEREGIFTPAITPLVLKKRKRIVTTQTNKDGMEMLVTGIPVFDDREEVRFVVSHIYEAVELMGIQAYLDKAAFEDPGMVKPREKQSDSESLIVESKSTRDVLQAIDKAAGLDVPVYFYGESGVGKLYYAKQLHRQSKYRDGTFIEVNCASVPDTLLQPELFGSKFKNDEAKKGCLEKAKGGTLYLQGVEALSVSSQHILSRAIREREGEFRLISSSEKSLGKMVREGAFLEELMYQLNIIEIPIKPLRERPEDLAEIILQYVREFSGKTGKHCQLSDPLFHTLMQQEWKNNTWEVRHVIAKLIAGADKPLITIEDLPPNYRYRMKEKSAAEIAGRTLTEILEEVEKEVLQEAKRQRKTTTAIGQLLGISQPSVVRKLKKYSL